jgi:hypothetical protein
MRYFSQLTMRFLLLFTAVLALHTAPSFAQQAMPACSSTR